ncbi:MAG: hypothetical protein A3I13_03830 [Gammaproteobacteria bacterium RIFCSPLOWO2_02_FULL_47_50]|nr:MAG: hypothetical protein A3I13_03830 [Gammaproteobacteria bacterium RIFCSPLOWO2_02_FULL_47_50]
MTDGKEIMNDQDDFKKTIAAGEKVFGSDLWRDPKYLGVETLIGRTKTWPCQLLLWWLFLSWGYVLYDVVIKNIGWLYGLIIIVPIHFLIYKLPVIHVIEPLSENELQEFLGNSDTADGCE